ncbi:phosphohistidine phosphatase SixA [Geomonas sp. Red32]|uniref:phosphohistidine phosphatase SixA n=1 Tax=Geomonas sp. Red32 TaxID=2912856 RepID=UPI00202CF352|nr:phosphohistidine phosphatase SixA [Geomonas sp. Red32]MCM0081398.1 phosphohistidine phosphatase SixA [Geomonas sp. Red32]
MIIHVVRHAEAVDRSPQVSEEHRYLTARGRERFRDAARAFKKAGFRPDVILTSPLVRAVQTADILAEALHFAGDCDVASQLSPGFRLSLLQKCLAGHREAKEVVLVGHEPDVGMLVHDLLEVNGPCSLKKGVIVSLETDGFKPGEAKLLQMITGGGKTIDSTAEALARLQE